MQLERETENNQELLCLQTYRATTEPCLHRNTRLLNLISRKEPLNYPCNFLLDPPKITTVIKSSGRRWIWFPLF